MDAGVIHRDAANLSGATPQGVQGLRLRRAGHRACDGEMGQQRLDLSWSPLLGGAFGVEKDRPSPPGEVGAFGTNRVVFSPDDFLRPLEEFLRGPRSMRLLDMDIFRLPPGAPWSL